MGEQANEVDQRERKRVLVHDGAAFGHDLPQHRLGRRRLSEQRRDTFSDLYFESSICEVVPPEDESTFESSRYGFSDLAGETFTIDVKD